jgi:hypothetical protein
MARTLLLVGCRREHPNLPTAKVLRAFFFLSPSRTAVILDKTFAPVKEVLYDAVMVHGVPPDEKG